MATKRKTDESPKTTAKKKKGSCDKEEDQEQDEEGSGEREKLRFLLVGKTGSGKSSSGNTILGRPVFSTDAGFSSVTDQCQLRSQVRFGASIDVMDCPGLFDSQASDEDVASTILEALSGMEPGPDVIGYVIAIGRYTEEEFGAYRRLKALLDNVTDYMVIVLTHGDRLKGEDVWNKLQQAPSHLQKVLEECGHRVVVLDNTPQRGKQSQVKRLVREARKLKNQNHRQPYTLELDNDAETEAEERLLRVEKMENRRKALVRKLIRKKAVAEENLIADRQSWTKRHQELEESCRKKERVLKNKKKDLSGKLRDQKELNDELENQIEALEEELREQRRAQFRH